MADKSVNIRLSLKDGDVVKRALLSLGDEGQKALKRITSAAPEVSRGLKVLSASVEEAKLGIRSWAEEAGAAGRVLHAFGPGGLAAAAGIGVAAFGIEKLWEKTKQAAESMSLLNDAAKRIGIGVEPLQALRFAATQLGVDVGTVDGALQKLSTTIGDIGRGDSPAAAAAFKQLGVSVVDAEGHLKSVEQILPELADGFSKVSDQQTRLSLSLDIFGRGQTGFVALLQDGSVALQDAIDKASKLGAVIDQDLVHTGAEATDQLKALSMVIDAQLTTALIDLVPFLITVMTNLKDIVQGVVEFDDALRSIDQRHLSSLRTEADALTASIEALQKRQAAGETLFGLPGLPGQFEGPIKAKQAELAAIQAEIDRREEIARREAAKRNFGDFPVVVDPDAKAKAAAAEKAAADAKRASDKAAADAQRAADKATADAQRELDRLMQEGVSIYNSTRTAAEAYANQVANLDKLLKAGAIDQDTYSRAVTAAADAYKQSIDEQRKAAEEAKKRAFEARTDAAAGVQRAFQDIQANADDFATTMHDGITGLFDDLEGVWEDWAATGEFSMDRLLESSKRFLAKLAFQYLESAIFKMLFPTAAAPGLLAPAAGVAPSIVGGPGAGLSSAFVPAIAKAIADAVVTPTAYVPAQRGLLQSQWTTQVAKPSMLPVQLPVMQSDVGGGMTVSPLGLTPAGLIRSFEGYRSNAYWDKTGYRVGYGSDTVTSAAGDVSRVTAATTTSIADATRDLTRRVADFQSVITGQIGPDAWARLGPNSKASLTSVAYNYGSLPSNVATAAQTGDPNQIASAIRGLSANPDRRIAEAQNALLDNSEKMADSTRQMTTSVDRSTQELSASLKGVADGTQKAGQEFANKFPSGLQSMMQAIGGGKGGMIDFFGSAFNSSFASILGPIGRPHGYYAKGDVFDRPRVFPMAQGWGLMAEAGPEAVMPLRRTRGGDLGVILASAGNDNRTAPQMSVQIINQFGGEANVETRQTRRSDGSPGLDVIFKRQVDQRINEQVPRINEVGFGQQKRLKLR